MDDLVVREGLYYEKFTNVPFTGEIDEGWERGPIKKGKPHGFWEYYDQDGQLLAKFHLSKGKREGPMLVFIPTEMYGGKAIIKTIKGMGFGSIIGMEDSYNPKVILRTIKRWVIG